MYIYGGYILTGGKLDDGRPWQGINVMLANVRDKNDVPMKAEIGKASRSDSLLHTLQGLAIGQPVDLSCDLHGKIVNLTPMK